MNIGIDIRNIGKKRTGDEVVFFNLVSTLSQIDKTNQYLLFTDINDPIKIKNGIMVPLGIGNAKNFKVISLKSSNKFIWNIWSLPKYLRANNPIDVYHTQYITPFFIPKKIKIITTIHDISFNYYPKFINFWDLIFLKILIPLSLRRANKIISVSYFTRDEIVKYYKIEPSKIETAHNAASENFDSADFSESHIEEIRKKYDLPQKFIFYIGTMQPRKNLPFLIKAYSNVRKKIPEIRLVLAGKKGHNHDREIDRVVKENGLTNYVFFPGYIDEEDKPLLFKMCHLFVFPSLYEGFGIPLLEAMSLGVPAIVSDIPSLRETFGKEGLFFDPVNIADLEKMLYNASVDENLRKNASNLGLTRSRIFSWELTVRKIMEIYKNTLNN